MIQPFGRRKKYIRILALVTVDPGQKVSFLTQSIYFKEFP